MGRYKLIILLLITVFLAGCILNSPLNETRPRVAPARPAYVLPEEPAAPTPDPNANLYIESLKTREYVASDIKIEQTLPAGSNYKKYIASYLSDGLKIYGLFTVPVAKKPDQGWPAIIMLHGYLDPKTYVTTARYVAYQDNLAKNGFITFKPDLRGHGRSQGEPVNSNFSQAYVIDTLNLIAALKIYKDADPDLIGLWGHSNGGGISLRTLEVSRDVKAAAIWAGVVWSYEDLLVTYRKKIPWLNRRDQGTGSRATTTKIATGSPEDLIAQYGEPTLASPFWSKVDPYSYLNNITAPVELHHGLADTDVPIELSRHLKDALTATGKTVELYEYPKADHNLSNPAFATAMKRTVEFFLKKYLK